MGDVQAQTVTRRPHPLLAPYVERYIGYRYVGFPAGVHRGMPSRHMTFIVSIGPEIDVITQTDRSQAPGRYRCVVGGLQASSAFIAHDGHQEGVAVELTPVGSRSLLGMPARALWNTSVELDDLAGPLGAELWERLQPATTWAGRFGACDDVLGRLVREAEVVPELRRSWGLLAESAGAAPVADVADAVGWTRQHLARRFKDEFGLSPKLAGRLLRFDRARWMLQATPSFVSISQVAAACGYYDQAHLSRDFTELAGCPPGQYLAEEDLPSVQDDEAPEPSS